MPGPHAALGSRIVPIDNLPRVRGTIRFDLGCRDEDVLHLKRVDEDLVDG